MSETIAKKSDLGVRTLSAIVMLTLAGGALWAGGWWWNVFVASAALGIMWEWFRLARSIAQSLVGLVLWLVAGGAYVALAGATMLVLRAEPDGAQKALFLIAGVVATDVGAYFAGRRFGGSKIAPSISPSKTWAGLFGGMFAAGAVYVAFFFVTLQDFTYAMLGVFLFLLGALVAVVAQAGDFFESWMKRRAGVKNSSHLIPGHGGLFDRADGLLAVCALMGVMQFGFGLG